MHYGQESDWHCSLHFLYRLADRFFCWRQGGAKFHLNQALLLIIGNIIVGILGVIPIVNIVAGILGLFLVVCWFIGLIAACKGEDKEIPLIGGIKILK